MQSSALVLGFIVFVGLCAGYYVVAAMSRVDRIMRRRGFAKLRRRALIKQQAEERERFKNSFCNDCWRWMTDHEIQQGHRRCVVCLDKRGITDISFYRDRGRRWSMTRHDEAS